MCQTIKTHSISPRMFQNELNHEVIDRVWDDIDLWQMECSTSNKTGRAAVVTDHDRTDGAPSLGHTICRSSVTGLGHSATEDPTDDRATSVLSSLPDIIACLESFLTNQPSTSDNIQNSTSRACQTSSVCKSVAAESLQNDPSHNTVINYNSVIDISAPQSTENQLGEFANSTNKCPTANSRPLVEKTQDNAETFGPRPNETTAQVTKQTFSDLDSADCKAPSSCLEIVQGQGGSETSCCEFGNVNNSCQYVTKAYFSLLKDSTSVQQCPTSPVRGEPSLDAATPASSSTCPIDLCTTPRDTMSSMNKLQRSSFSPNLHIPRSPIMTRKRIRGRRSKSNERTEVFRTVKATMTLVTSSSKEEIV